MQLTGEDYLHQDPNLQSLPGNREQEFPHIKILQQNTEGTVELEPKSDSKEEIEYKTKEGWEESNLITKVTELRYRYKEQSIC